MMFKQLYLSLFSADFYRQEVKPNPEKTGYGFLFLISCLNSLFLTAILIYGFINEGEAQISAFIKQTPEVTVTDGELSIDRQSPYYVMVESKPVGVFDTREDKAKLSVDEIASIMKEQDLKFFVTKTNVITSKKRENRVYDLGEAGDGTTKFNADDAMGIYNTYKYVVIAAVPFILLPLIFIFNIVLMFLYSICGVIINKIMSAKASYNTILRITAYALWALSVLWYFEMLLEIRIPTYVSIAIMCGYQIFALRLAKTQQQLS